MLELRRSCKVWNGPLFYQVVKSPKMVTGIGMESQTLESLMNEGP